MAHNLEDISHSTEVKVSHKLDGCVRMDGDAFTMPAWVSLRMINYTTGAVAVDCPLPPRISQRKALAVPICQDVLEYFAHSAAGIERFKPLSGKLLCTMIENIPCSLVARV
ncbi:hypothetical protein ACO0LL_18265 [Undibacterium sp. TC4M20W]|uniref:hypothetical protein n=1 Tax=Undibacterium sp. TC4M20W TaxID=3413052 RepID=UPI003BF06C9F